MAVPMCAAPARALTVRARVKWARMASVAPPDGVGVFDADADVSVRRSLGLLLSTGVRGAAAADRLCGACIDLLHVDAAAISVIDEGMSRGTIGASHENARQLDELQFTLGEGPCLEAARTVQAVMIADLDDLEGQRWPTLAEAARNAGIRAIFAVPVRVGSIGLGALDLFRFTPGPLSVWQVAAAKLVAEAASLAVLDLLAACDESDEGEERDAGPTGLRAWEQLTSWARVEVYQATGVIMAQLEISAAEALVRLRGYAFAHELGSTEAARLILSRQLRLEP